MKYVLDSNVAIKWVLPEPDSDKAIRLRDDCLYVALAERDVCELVTADVRLLNNLKPTFPFIINLASLP